MKKLFVVFAAIALIGAFTVPAMAADWDFYGSIRMGTFWDDMDLGDGRTVAGDDDDGDTTFDLQGNSRIGARVTSGDVAARIELSVDDDKGVNTRLLYGTWEFADGCKLLIGQDYTPIYVNLSGQVHNEDDGLNPWGMAYDGRQPQIKLLINNFELAFIEPENGPAEDLLDVLEVAEYDVDVTFPKIAARYTFKTDAFAIRPFAGWQTVSAEWDDDDEDIDAWVVGADAKFYFGPAWLALAGYYSQNPAIYGLVLPTQNIGSASKQALGVRSANTLLGANDFSPFGMPGYTDSIEDNETYGLAAAAGYKFNDMVSMEVGFGYVNSQTDDFDEGVDFEGESMTYYVNVPIKLADLFFIIPEIGFIDYGDFERTGASDWDEGDSWYAGAKWQIDF